ncbi:HVA22-like protein j, partial [Smittium culicis]
MYKSYLLFSKFGFAQQKSMETDNFLSNLNSNLTYNNATLKAELEYFVKYWSVMAWFTAFEFIADFFLFLLPFYGVLKLSVILYLCLPQFLGAEYVYDNYLLPFIFKNKTNIDLYYNKINDTFFMATSELNNNQTSQNQDHQSSAIPSIINGYNNLTNILSPNSNPTGSNNFNNNYGYTNNNSSSSNAQQNHQKQSAIDLINNSLSAIGKVSQLLSNSNQGVPNTTNMQSFSSRSTDQFDHTDSSNFSSIDAS